MDGYLAHIAEDGRQQTVDEHLRGTAELCRRFAAEFQSGEHGYLAGMAHDIGKYSEGFQRRLNGGPKVDHSSAGAVECAAIGAKFAGACVAGHHGGLPDFGNMRVDCAGEPTYYGRLKQAIAQRGKAYPGWSTSLPATQAEPTFDGDRFAQSLWCRMLFSSLVDADFLDTECFMSGQAVERGAFDDLPVLLERLNAYLQPWQHPTTEINRTRCRILRGCMDAGSTERGLFTLTVPTGGGKTVASLAFALHHAIHNRMSRVIYVIPYTSIIEQNAAVFRRIVGDRNVVEHHSETVLHEDMDISANNSREALATENWDAPVIVTTAVQFFESLYSNKPSKCRKLHSIANSVVIFDEAQMIPASRLRPCIAAIANLVSHFHVSAVLCTATQPALNDLFYDYAPQLRIREITGEVHRTYQTLRRVTYRYAGKLSADRLADQLSGSDQVLCIVNTRKCAQEIYERLPEEGSFHLSTLMYPKHRQETLEVIRTRLRDGKPCRVVSTSLIEAGVDVDFPAVYRELSGLDSIVQAAGRCNREGTRRAEESVVTVFEGDLSAPSLLKVNIGAAREALAVFQDPGSPEAVERYFTAYRSLLGDGLDIANTVCHLTNGIAGCEFPFRTVAEEFHIIDRSTKTVYIPLDGGESVIRELTDGNVTRSTYRRAGRYGVNIFEKHYAALLGAGDIRAINDACAVLVNTSLYSQKTGLSLHADSGKGEFI